MMDMSKPQPKLVVMIPTIGGRLTLKEGTSLLLECPGDLSERVYDPSCYIVPTSQTKPELVLLISVDINVVREDGSSQGLDDLVDLEEDLDNLQFFDEHD